VHAERRRGSTRQRILYWFRTPPNIRIGRAALDEEAIRALEEGNPDIVFDWSKILEAQPQPTPVATPERGRRPRDSQAQSRRPRPSQARSRPSVVASPEVSVSAEPVPVEAVAAEEPIGAQVASEAMAPEGPASEIVDVEPPALVPVTVYHGGADVYLPDPSDVPRQSPVAEHLGSEQLGRVRARYAEILARITERMGGDATRLEEMRRAADGLNPDTWVTEAEITAGLQHFDAQLGEIRRALGIKRRRRSRRGGRNRHRSGGAPGSPEVAGESAPPDASLDTAGETEGLANEAAEGEPAADEGEDEAGD
jgi:hypothetical protein